MLERQSHRSEQLFRRISPEKSFPSDCAVERVHTSQMVQTFQDFPRREECAQKM